VYKNGDKSQNYIVDISGKLPVILCELDAEDDDSLTNSYIWADGQVLCQYTHNGDETIDERFYYVDDRLGGVWRFTPVNKFTGVTQYVCGWWGRFSGGEVFVG